MMEAIGEKIGRSPEFQDTSFETIFRDVGQGKFEAVASAATITPEREKEVAFSDPYYLSEQAILVKEGSAITGLADLRARWSAPSREPRASRREEKSQRERTAPLPRRPGRDQRAQGRNGRSRDHRRAGGAERGRRSGGIEIAENVPTEEEYGFAVAKNNTELLKEINTGLKEVISDGTYTKIYKKWFHLEPPKQFRG